MDRPPPPAAGPAAHGADDRLAPREPRTVPVAELRSRLSDALGRVRHTGERLVLTTHGTAVAAVVPLDDLVRLQQVDVVGIPVPGVQQSVVLALDPATLWRTLVDGRYRAPWWPVDTFGHVPGDRVRDRWLTADGRVVDLVGEVLALEEGRSITSTWAESGCARPTTVRLAVEAATGGASLTVTETGFGPLEALRAEEHRRQWAELLERLAALVGSRAR